MGAWEGEETWTDRGITRVEVPPRPLSGAWGSRSSVARGARRCLARGGRPSHVGCEAITTHASPAAGVADGPVLVTLDVAPPARRAATP